VKRYLAAAAGAAVLAGLAGCTAAKTDSAAAAVEHSAEETAAAELTSTAQEFADALAAGDHIKALTFLGDTCPDSDRATLVGAARRIHDGVAAAGSGPLKPGRVVVTGNRGLVVDFSSGPSDSETYAPIGAGGWIKENGHWYATCDRAGVMESFMTPTPAAG
jgi:hypothetical protein